jgi:hypothetical protein
MKPQVSILSGYQAAMAQSQLIPKPQAQTGGIDAEWFK